MLPIKRETFDGAAHSASLPDLIRQSILFERLLRRLMDTRVKPAYDASDLFLVIEIMWRATVLTLFPEMFPGPLGVSLAGKALASGVWALEARDIRASATDRHRSVDDTPAGGGPGMVLRADVLAAAIDAARAAQDRPRLLMSPRGRPLTQSLVV